MGRAKRRRAAAVPKTRRVRTPETFVIAPDGTITAKKVGAVTYAWLTREIESALRKEAGV